MTQGFARIQKMAEIETDGVRSTGTAHSRRLIEVSVDEWAEEVDYVVEGQAESLEVGLGAVQPCIFHTARISEQSESRYLHTQGLDATVLHSP